MPDRITEQGKTYEDPYLNNIWDRSENPTIERGKLYKIEDDLDSAEHEDIYEELTTLLEQETQSFLGKRLAFLEYLDRTRPQAEPHVLVERRIGSVSVSAAQETA